LTAGINDRGPPRGPPRVEAVGIVLRAILSMEIESPISFREDRFGGGVLAIAFAEARLVGMRRIAGDWFCPDRAVVVGMLGVGQAVITPNAAPLAPPQARLAPTAFCANVDVGA
jgi:hypothetical protein